MFGSLSKLLGGVVDIVTAPVEIVLDTANAVIEPVAEAATEIVEDIKRWSGSVK